MSSRQKVIDLGYRPRPFQEQLHQELRRFNVIVAHRRFGKTWFSFAEMIHQSLSNTKRDPQYAYIAPNYGQAKRVAWDILKTLTANIPNRTVNEAELRVDIHRPHSGDRIRFVLLGAENPDSIRGMYLDGVMLDEYGVMNPMMWIQVVRPALSDRLGWGIFIGTPNGKNHFKDMYDYAKSGSDSDWYCNLFKASQTGLIAKSELNAAKATMSDEMYAQEFECDWGAALQGAYYGKELVTMRNQKRICEVPYQRGFGVLTGWDLGMDDSTAIWVAQRSGKALHFIDYIESSGEGLDYYVARLKEGGYIHDDNFFPHDVAVRELTNKGKTRKQTLENELKFRPVTVIPKQNPEDGIHAVRMLLSRSYIDEKRCAKGIECLENYQRKWDPKGAVWLPKPLHNWASHGADAMRTFAMGLDDDANKYKYDPKKNVSVAETDYDIYDYS